MDTSGSSLDAIDREIIAILSTDGRASAAEISQRIGKTSERTIRNRISSLLQSRQIVIGAIPDPTVAEPGVQAEVMIEIEPGRIAEVAAALGALDQVFYLAATTGEYGLSASIMGASNTELFEFAEARIAKAPGVRRINISLVMRLYKIFGTRTTALPDESAAPAGKGKK
ncbi:MAG: Lrp/AsnC family transcriptional regulator [Paracoccaceae bacterium]